MGRKKDIGESVHEVGRGYSKWSNDKVQIRWRS